MFSKLARLRYGSCCAQCNATNVFRGNTIFLSLIVTNHVAAGIFGGDAYAYNRLLAFVGLGSTSGAGDETSTDK